MNRSLLLRSLLRIGLVGILLIAASSSYARRTDDLKQAGIAIRSHALRINPGLRGHRIRFSGTIDGGGGLNDVCACITVCDGKGENCTKCSCSPANCGTCG